MQKYPGGQTSPLDVTDPAGQKCPTAVSQAWQVSEDEAPTVVENLPASQSKHDPLVGELYVPVPHDMQAAAEVLEYFPLSHAIQSSSSSLPSPGA